MEEELIRQPRLVISKRRFVRRRVGTRTACNAMGPLPPLLVIIYAHCAMLDAIHAKERPVGNACIIFVAVNLVVNCAFSAAFSSSESDRWIGEI